ncbi:hypothetical protein ACFLQ1_00700 [Candidatus Auribacterota bacterium]
MGSISENFVREYFELNNFSVKINKKYAFSSQRRNDLEEINLIVQNIKDNVDEGEKKKPFLLEESSIQKIKKGIVEVKGWHTGKFSPSVLIKSPHIFNFVEKKVLKAAERFLGTKDFKKILVIPRLPKAKDTRNKSIKIMKEKGIDHVLEFKTILDYIIQHIKINKNYIESDILQTIRLLKNYDLIKDRQLELFSKNDR